MSLSPMVPFFILLTVFLAVTGVDVKKRILMSDPAYIQQELHEIHVKLQQYDGMKSQLASHQSMLTAQDALIKSLFAKNSLLESRINDAASKGVVYVRWGRKDCQGNTTELVYSGFAGGSHYAHSGASAEYVCLPPDPLWGPHKDSPSYLPSVMYGAEYEDTVLFNVQNRNEEVPCAVCRTSTHSTSIMIPARTACYPGWEEAYHGNLAGQYFAHPAGGEYVCVDEDPQTLIGGGRTDDNGKLFYQVRTRCGSLKCPPYEEDKVLSCVVCLK
ncbi:short-chain collagen C4-like [Pecten maximus]|uniref:short-chain collagen C4-like n=1 Tax=Pecten maximus TaxID=6579 RepID=UPI001458F91F|nr:short-chain collagen C4-like [Pecten maximus]